MTESLILSMLSSIERLLYICFPEDRLTCTIFDGTVGDAPETYHNALTQNGAEHIWHQLTDGDHGAISVRAHMYNFLRYVFKA